MHAVPPIAIVRAAEIEDPDPAVLPGAREIDPRRRLQARQGEIEAAALARVTAIESIGEVADAEYLQGLRRAVRAALRLAIHSPQGVDISLGEVPSELTTQARVAARSGVGLDIVLRRYLAGHTLLCEYLIEDADGGEEQQQMLHVLAALLDRIIVAVAAAFRDEMDQRHYTTEQHRAARVKGALQGRVVDAVKLDYEFDGWHLGVVAEGPGAAETLRELAAEFGARFLLVRPGEGASWAWLGVNRKLASRRLVERAVDSLQLETVLAVGEPGRDIAGWRFTHRQAKAALPIARCQTPAVLAYAGSALAASTLRDPILSRSLRTTYLEPLETERDGGAVLRETLTAYFNAGGNTSSAAAALGVNRNTVAERLRGVEAKFGCPLESCSAELQTALRLYELGRHGYLASGEVPF